MAASGSHLGTMCNPKAFQPAVANLLPGAFADTQFLEKVLVDLERLRLALGERKAKQQLQNPDLREAVVDVTSRRFRPIDKGRGPQLRKQPQQSDK